MAVNLYNIKRWILMISGKSIYHVNQNMGEFFIPGKVHGYFNNMTEKVTKAPQFITNEELPYLITEKNEKVIFPVGVFQYGLGAWDLYLKTNDSSYIHKFIEIADWSVQNQKDDGAWNNFFYYYPDNPYGAMCQGEGVSLLIRAFQFSHNEEYLQAATKAIDFLIKDVKEGGTTSYEEGLPCFLEYTHRPAVFNGWVFALFGLYDYLLIVDDPDKSKLLKETIDLLKQKLCLFDNGFWSIYDLDGRIASPFYHNLHIAQLQALYEITNDNLFLEYKNRFKKYDGCAWNRTKAFVIKSVQKLIEK